MVSASCASISARLAFERVDLGAPRGQFLLAALHFERVGFRHLERAARVFHLSLRRLDHFHARAGLHQRIAAAWACFKAASAVSQRLRYWSYCAVEMSSFL